MRNTPTGVGKTIYAAPLLMPQKKHPHGRGEDCSFSTGSPQSRETPPRAWGRRDVGDDLHKISGNTPTGVGKTDGMVYDPKYGGKHPHGRGEDALWHLNLNGALRNTPTGVGKTQAGAGIRGHGQKHPHGRGEDAISTSKDQG